MNGEDYAVSCSVFSKKIKLHYQDYGVPCSALTKPVYKKFLGLKLQTMKSYYDENDRTTCYTQQNYCISATKPEDVDEIVYVRGVWINKCWIDLIFRGKKTWEIRNFDWNGELNKNVFICYKGIIYGTMQIKNSFQSSQYVLQQKTAQLKHQVYDWNKVPNYYLKTPFIWVLQSIKKFDHPIPYMRIQGAQTWQRIPTWKGYIFHHSQKLQKSFAACIPYTLKSIESIRANACNTTTTTTNYTIWNTKFVETCKKNEISEKQLIKIISKTVQSVYEYCWCISYLNCIIQRNESIKCTLQQICNDLNQIEKFVQNLLNKKKLHHGKSYKINNHKISTWKQNAKKCIRHSNFLLMNDSLQKDDICCCCKRTAVMGSAPFVMCSLGCKQLYHLHCLPASLLKYKRPTTTEPHKRTYERKYCYENCKIKCHQCRSKLITEKIAEGVTNYEYIGKIKHYHYLSKQIENKFKYYKCSKDVLNTYYCAISQWYNDLIPNDFINYDKWCNIKYNTNDFKKSAAKFEELLKETFTMYPKYKTIWNKLKYDDDNTNFDPIKCEPTFYKSNICIGSKIFSHVFFKRELNLLKYIAAQQTCEKIKYHITPKKTTNKEIKSIQPLHEDGRLKKLISKHHQQFDFAGMRLRVKVYYGYAHYTNPCIGNSSTLKKKMGQKLNSINNNDNELSTEEQTKYINKINNNIKQSKAVLCRIPEPQHYPKIMQLFNEFVNIRYKSINARWNTNKTNQVQLNAYAAGGRIESHYDNQSWFDKVLLMKIFNNSGLHLSCHGVTGHPIHPYFYHPLMEGSLLELTKWTFTYWHHSRFPWMSKDGGSITGIFRDVVSNPIYHQYPDPSNKKCVFIPPGKLDLHQSSCVLHE